MRKLIDNFGNVYFLEDKGKLKIGRHNENDIPLPPKNSPLRRNDFLSLPKNKGLARIILNISREHAIIYKEDDGRSYLVDLDSTNGTYVNDERISPGVKVPLIEGTRIRLGNYEMTYREES